VHEIWKDTNFMQLNINYMNKYSKIGLAFLAGAVVGAIAGVLLAPDKGSETRKKMADKARDLSDAMKEKARKGWQQASDLKEKIVREAEEAVS
jgi:gas vesicle protein